MARLVNRNAHVSMAFDVVLKRPRSITSPALVESAVMDPTDADAHADRQLYLATLLGYFRD